jgi:hypothetical protein
MCVIVDYWSHKTSRESKNQGLPFKGEKCEAAYKLDHSSLNHGNFLEIILLLSKYYNILKSNLEKLIKLSKEHDDRAQNINMKALKTIRY